MVAVVVIGMAVIVVAMVIVVVVPTNAFRVA